MVVIGFIFLDKSFTLMMNLHVFMAAIFLFALDLNSCSNTKSKKVEPVEIPAISIPAGTEKAYLASGCFWCVEAIFESVEGVVEVVSGYSGGEAKDANYDAVSSGGTNHAEAVEVYYDPSKIDYKTILKVFFGSHDFTTLNRQGPDAGRQYRSAIFYQNEAEKATAESFIERLYLDGGLPQGTVTTELVALKAFYPAEDYHQNYERLHPNEGYIKGVSIPRLKKFQALYPELLKKAASH
jgi:peptide-methionine (S)-S-oxide reductase